MSVSKPPPSHSRTAKQQVELALVDHITHYATPTDKEIVAWYYADAVLERDWSRPLVRVLRFFVEQDRSSTTALVGDDEPQIDLIDRVHGAATFDGSVVVA